MVSVQSKHLPEYEIKQLASLYPFITTSQRCSDSREQAIKVAEEIAQLIDDLGLKSTLREYKVPRIDFVGIVERALPNGKQDVRYQALVEFLQSVY